MSDLRDHSLPCEHGVEVYCGNVIAETGKRCPGGRAVTEAEIIAAYLGRTSATGGNIDADAI